jgi:tRNA/rRNA methyltransferase
MSAATLANVPSEVKEVKGTIDALGRPQYGEAERLSERTGGVVTAISGDIMSTEPVVSAGAQAALDHIRIVLVEPQHAGNIGAVARAMKNMALSRLVLVNPVDHLGLEARMMAMHGLDILQQAQVVHTLAQGVADAGYVVGTTRRLGKGRQVTLTSRGIAPLLLELAATNPLAIVFGREDSGLSNEELLVCHELITIPAHPVHGSLNLAQAVLLVCYELFVASANPSVSPPPRLASVQELERLYARMRAVLSHIGFLHGSHPDRMMGYFRRFFARQGLRSRDVKVFLGVFRQIEWYITRHLPQGSPSSPPPGGSRPAETGAATGTPALPSGDAD